MGTRIADILNEKGSIFHVRMAESSEVAMAMADSSMIAEYRSRH